jgi:transcription elongation factor Elf1
MNNFDVLTLWVTCPECNTENPLAMTLPVKPQRFTVTGECSECGTELSAVAELPPPDEG